MLTRDTQVVCFTVIWENSHQIWKLKGNKLLQRLEPIAKKLCISVKCSFTPDEKLVYSGPRTSYIANDLTPNTKYSFYLQASTEGDDSPLSKNVSVVTPESGTSNPSETPTSKQVKSTLD